MRDTVYVTVEDTRSALVRAGVELLEETGSADVGLRSIARRAGVSHGAPRRWFPTHRSLLAAIAEVGLRDLAAALAGAAQRSGNDLAEIAAAYVDFARRRPAMFTLVFRHDLLEGSGAGLRNVSQPLFDWLATMIKESADVRDPQQSAAALWVGIHGIAVLSSTGSLELAAGGVNEGELINRIVQSSLR
ncbi:TetR family transcriptional regulator [Rhodococcus hoagii]|nr:TetR family transcriptional regulator [Prescottella equi]NKW46190.1 TetR family transcriptional regulator [Prescottella equi]